MFAIKEARVKRNVIKTMIVGASGYTGAELLRLLAVHPEADVVAATSETYAGQAASTIYPQLRGAADITFKPLREVKGHEADVVFTALPHGRSMDAVAELLASGFRVVDLSGDFRLESATEYEQWYKTAHTHPELLKQSAYGLPEMNREHIVTAGLVSNPGCYPTSAILALLPALENSLIDATGIVIDSISGVSGAGRAANATTHFCARADSVVAYKTGGAHQHIPEMERYMSGACGATVTISFTPHLGPYSRGIYTTAYANLRDSVSLDQVRDAYVKRYDDCPFVEVLDAGVMPELKAVAGSNYCHIGLAVDTRTRRLIVASAIDNLVKGASGQAIQNMNIMFGLPETTGLEQIGLWP